MNTEQKAREWLAKPNQLDTRMMIASLENAEEIITDLLDEREELLVALKYSLTKASATAKEMVIRESIKMCEDKV